MSENGFRATYDRTYESTSPSGPSVTDEYRDSLMDTVVFEEDGVTAFEGCKLELSGIDDVWFCPVTVSDEKGLSYFHLILQGQQPDEFFGKDERQAIAVDFDDTSLKLDDQNRSSQSRFRTLFDPPGPHRAFVRQCVTGMPFYPASMGLTQSDGAATRIQRLAAAFGISDTRPLFEDVVRASKLDTKSDSKLTEPEKRHFGNSILYHRTVILDDDPWRRYDIFSPNRLEDVPHSDLSVRIDSGCDIGQLYDDLGCDCREQLHSAIHAIQNEGSGLVVHIPAQDGRGYGAALIAKIVGIERGSVPYREGAEGAPTDGVSVSRTLLGNRYDNRTYGGVGKVLAELGVKSVMLRTDNKLKVRGLEESGIGVKRVSTETTGANGSMERVLEKHSKTQNYYQRDE